jgi:hypothetical protein
METTEKIYLTSDYFKGEHLRKFDDMKQFASCFRGPKIWSWGFNSPTNVENTLFRFKVQGHHFKGFVWIAPNGSDLFNVYYSTARRSENGCYYLIDKQTDIFGEDIIDVIDRRVERIAEYVR